MNQIDISKFPWLVLSLPKEDVSEQAGVRSVLIWSVWRLALEWPRHHPRTLHANHYFTRRNGTNNCSPPIETGAATRPRRTAKKLISIRIAAGRANHTSLSKWTIFPRGWMRRPCLADGGSNGKNANIRGWVLGGGTHLDFAFHHSPQLYLLISSSIFAAPLADKPATLTMPPQSWTWKGARQRNQN